MFAFSRGGMTVVSDLSAAHGLASIITDLHADE
jgi:hypothetical protein